MDSDQLQKILEFAAQQLGKTYKMDAKGPDIWDCSGLTKGAYAAGGIEIRDGSFNQYDDTNATEEPEAGGLAFMKNEHGIKHVALIYDLNIVIEASLSHGQVIATPIEEFKKGRAGLMFAGFRSY